MHLFSIAKKQSISERKISIWDFLFRIFRCRHLMICNYFGEMLMKPCETMCDVCTQRELVSINLQNLKVNSKMKIFFVLNLRFFRKRNLMKSTIDVRQIVLYIVMKAMKNSMKVVELEIDVMNENIVIQTMIIDMMRKPNPLN
jgi:hypothetical protein